MKRINYAIIAVAALLTFTFYAIAADEITINGLLKLDNGEMRLQRTISSQTIDQSVQGMSYNIQNVGTSTHEQVTIIADVETNGVTWFRNLTTNENRYVEIGARGPASNFCPIIRLNASEITITRLHPTNSVWVKAYGGAIKLEAWVNAN